MANWRIPLSDLSITEDEQAAVISVLQRRWLSMGEEVEGFEREFAEYLGVQYAIAVSNGTAALHIALMALDIGPGDEVIQPALNFVAAANMTLAQGATPVLVDIEALDSPLCDPVEIEQCMTERTRAVVVMHYGGHLCDMESIVRLCQRRGVALIEDACHAIGGAHPGPSGLHRAGAFGEFGCFSFFSNKNLVTGEGGMVATSREDLWQTARLLRSHGMTTMSWDRFSGHASSYTVLRPGFNYRLDDMRAALGRRQLSKLDANNSARQALVREYIRRLKGLEGWLVPFADRRETSAHHLMVLVAPDRQRRDRLVQGLQSNGVQTSLHYPYLPDFPPFRSSPQRDLPRTRAFTERAITLPLYPQMTASQVNDICDIAERIAAESHP